MHLPVCMAMPSRTRLRTGVGERTPSHAVMFQKSERGQPSQARRWNLS